MPGLTPPVKEEPKRLFLKMLVVVVLITGAGVMIWSTSVDQRISLTESAMLGDLGITPEVLTRVEGFNIYAVDRTNGTVPVVLLHDMDISGSVTLDALVESVGGDTRVVTIDLPGFGLSQRIPEPGPQHTVASMGRTVAAVISERYSVPVVVAGVGLGGEVAAEVAATRPELVRGLVMIDVDFWRNEGWSVRVQRFPFIGRSMTFQNEVSPAAPSTGWAPYCDRGGWCPTPAQHERRRLAATISNSTSSVNAFRHTPRASFVPEDLDLITAPTIYVWSTKGPVPRSSVEEIEKAISSFSLIEIEAFQVHLEDPTAVASAIASVIAP